jgi:hypothetical protein
MRKMLHILIGLFLLFSFAGTMKAHAESDFKVTLLGTASPQPFPNRFGPSTLLSRQQYRRHPEP